jgi:hypothetical protein
VECVLGLIVLVAVCVKVPPIPVLVAILVALATLIVQVAVVRRWLNRRSDAVLAGEDAPRSRGHLVYIALEVIKAVALLTTGIGLLGAQ